MVGGRAGPWPRYNWRHGPLAPGWLLQAQNGGDPAYSLVALAAFTGINLGQDGLALLFSEVGEEGHERVLRGTPIHTLHKIFLRQMDIVFGGKLPPERRNGVVGIHNHPIHIEKNRFVHHPVRYSLISPLASGKVNQKVEPRPGALSTPTCPWCCSTIAFAIANPNPNPPPVPRYIDGSV